MEKKKIAEELILDTLIDTNFNMAETANRLNMPRNTLYYKINNSPDLSERVKRMKGVYAFLLMEGLSHPDLNIRHKFFSLIPANRLADILQITASDNEKVINLTKGEINLF